MDIVCDVKHNAIFWRNSAKDEWSCEDLDVMIQAYEDEPYTNLTYWTTVYKENTEEPLYYVFRCEECGEPVLTVDMNHDYEFCPHCGRAIWRD